MGFDGEEVCEWLKWMRPGVVFALILSAFEVRHWRSVGELGIEQFVAMLLLEFRHAGHGII